MIHDIIDIEVEGSKTTYKPKLYTYVIDNSPSIDEDRLRPAVLICPGGAYRRTSDREAEPIAIQMNAMGYQAFVLRYSCYPDAVFPTAQLEAAMAIKMIRERARVWHVDVNKVVILGFSAGGHLAASIGTFWNKEFLSNPLKTTPEMIRPNAMILCYPVITSSEFAHQESIQNLLGDKQEDAEFLELVSLEKQVTSETPKTFIWHTFEDQMVPLENTLLFVSSLRKANVPTEVHIYPRGVHGLSLANEETRFAEGSKASIVEECQSWITMAGSFIRRLQ